MVSGKDLSPKVETARLTLTSVSCAKSLYLRADVPSIAG
jgi:hypothetical protein